MKKIYCFVLVSILLLSQSSLLNPSLQVFSQELQKTQESPELAEAVSLSETVRKLVKEKKYKEALPLARRALEIRERLLPASDLRIEASLTYLGDVYLAMRDYGDAKKTYQLLLQKQGQRLGTSGGNLSPTLDRICIVNFRERNYDQAEQTCKRSLAIKELSLGPNHADVANSLFMLAEQHRSRGNADLAAPLYLRALSIYGELSAERSPRFEQVYDGFTCLCHQTQKPELFEQLKSIDKRYPAIPKDPAVQKEDRILNGRALSLPKPDYPPEARRNGEEGMVLVKVMVDETGKVISAYDMCQGPPAISYSSVKAAKSARFAPTKLSGIPIKTHGYLYYRFVIR